MESREHFRREIQERFGRNVKALRAATGVSQDAFADQVGIHRTFMSGIERGKRAPTIIVVAKLAAALGVDPGVLFADDSRSTSPK